MQQVFLNEIKGLSFEDGKVAEVKQDAPNRVTNLADLRKSQILTELFQLVTYPSRYALGIAEELPSGYKMAPKDMITLAEWLEEKQIELAKPTKHLLARIVGRRYREAFGTNPRQVARKSPNNSNWSKKASGFEPAHLYILEASLDEVLALKGITEAEAGEEAGTRVGFRSYPKDNSDLLTEA